MADDNSTARKRRAEKAEADAIARELARHAKATKVAEGLQASKAARDAARKGGKGK